MPSRLIVFGVSFTAIELEALIEVLDLLVLDYGCKHAIIEQHLGETATGADVYPSLVSACKSACPTCLPKTAYEHVFPPLKKSGIHRLLLQEFSKMGRMLLVPPSKKEKEFCSLVGLGVITEVGLEFRFEGTEVGF